MTLTHQPLGARLAAHVDAYEPHIEKTLISSEEIQHKVHLSTTPRHLQRGHEHRVHRLASRWSHHEAIPT